jgi:hypothetical protein
MHRTLIFFFSIFISSCASHPKFIELDIENSSDVRPVINMEIYREDKLFRKEIVRKYNVARFTELRIQNIPDTLFLRFVIPQTKEETSCEILKKNIDKNFATVHVNLTEILFKKGDTYKGSILDKDSIMKRNFYCEVMY